MTGYSSSCVVIVGGGIIGSSIAYQLAAADAGVDVVVVEPDPSYKWAATPRATGTIRRTFTLPEKIQMSTFAHEIYSNFSAISSVNGEDVADVQFRRDGFLYMAWGKEKVAYLERAHAMILPHYPEIMFLDAKEISARYPSINTADVDIGLFAPDDGWIDAASALQGYAKKAKSLGARYVTDRVVGFSFSPHRVSEVKLASGGSIKADAVVNCANCWAAEVAEMVGMRIPVQPLRRMTYYFDMRERIEPLPVTRDINGVSVRPEGRGHIAGVTAYDVPYGFDWEPDYNWFDETVWPAIAARIPAFEAIKLQSCWAGHYDMNTLDRTTIVGPWVGGVENFYVAAGFSGHGLQQAPAIGRAIKELLIDGEYITIDLTRLGYQRILDGTPLIDEGIWS